MEREKAIGVYIFGICGILASLGLLVFIVRSPGSLLPKTGNIFLILINIVFDILPLAGLAAAIGVLLLKNWARILFIVISIIMISMGLFAFSIVLLSGKANLIGFIKGMSVSVIPFVAAIVYFCRPKIKALFKPHSLKDANA